MSEVECCDINEGSLNSELRALIISCTEQYAELWDLISKDTIDIQHLDKLSGSIASTLPRTMESWEFLVNRSEGVANVNIQMKANYIRFLIEVSPHRREGFQLLSRIRSEEGDAWIERELPEYSNHSLNDVTATSGTATLDSKMKEDIEKTRNDVDIPRSAISLRIFGAVFIVVAVILNSFEWHIAADSFSEHLASLRVVTATNRLQSETQSLVTYVQDLSLLRLSENSSSSTEKEKLTAGLSESISKLNDLQLQLESSVKMNGFKSESIQIFTGVDVRKTEVSTIGNVMERVLSIAVEILSLRVHDSSSSDVFTQSERYLLLNSMNGLRQSQLKIYRDFVEEFARESEELANTNVIMMIFTAFILTQLVCTVIWLTWRVTETRKSIVKKLLAIPINVSTQLLGNCKNLLVKGFMMNEGDIMDRLQKNNEKRFKPLGVSKGLRQHSSFEVFSPDEETGDAVSQSVLSSRLYNAVSGKMIAFTVILGVVFSIYFLSNFYVQRGLASDMGMFVKMENATAISEVDYMFADNTLHMLLMNSTYPILHKDSKTVLREALDEMQEQRQRVQEFTKKIKNVNLKKAVNSIMLKNPCEIIAEESEKVATKEQCEAFENGILVHGLEKGMEKFIELSLAVDISQGIDVLLHSQQVKQARILQRIYIKEGLLVLKDKLKRIIEKTMEDFLKWKEFSWYGGILLIVLVYLQLHFNLIQATPRNLNAARNALKVIPTG